MAGEDVSVRFGADTGGMEAGGATAKGVVASLQEAVASLAAVFKGMGGAAVAGFGEATTAAKETVVQVKEAAEAVEGFRKSFAGIGEAVIAALAVGEIAEFAKKMAEGAEQVAHMATTFGLTTVQVQQLKGLAAGAGVPFEALATAMQREDRALTLAREGSKQAAEAFKTLGVNIKEPVDNATLLQESIAGLATIQDVPTRVGLAMQLFGRNIQNLGPIIGLTKEQLQEINQSISDYGVVSEDAQQKGLALAEAFNQNHLAMMGLGNVMTSTFAPTLTAIVEGINNLIKGFVQSYTAGGAAKTMMDGLNAVLKIGSAIVAGVGAAFVIAFDAVKGAIASVPAVWQLLVDEIIGKAKESADAVMTLGRVIYAALSNNMADAVAAVSAGNAQMQKDFDETARKAIADAAKIKAAFAAGGGNEIGGVLKWGDNFLAGLDAQHKAASGAQGGGGGAVPNLGGGKKGRGAGKDQMAEYRAALEQQEDQIRASTGAWLADLSQMDLDYWQGILAHAKLTAAQRAEVERTIAELTKKINGDAESAKLEQDRAAIDAAKGNIVTLTAAWQKYVADATTAYRAGSTQAIKAQQEETDALKAAIKEIVEARIKGVEQESAELEKGVQADIQRQKEANDEAIQALKQKFDAGQIGARAYYAQLDAMRRADAQQEVATIQAGVAVRLAALDAELDDDRLTAAQRQEILRQEEDADRAAAAEIAKIRANTYKQIGQDQVQQLNQMKQQFNSFVDPMVSSFSKGLLEMAEGTKSFQQVMRSMGQQLLNDLINVIDKMVEKWLWGQISQVLATNTANAEKTASNAASAAAGNAANRVANQQTILQDANVAAANVYKTVSGIPIVGPFLAPPAAAAAFAAVEAFSSAGGLWNVPFDNAPALLHANETVLPASIANPMRDFFEGAGSGGAGGAGGGDINFGDFHVHGAPSGMSSSEFRQALSDHASHVAGAVASSLQAGWRPSYKRPFGAL